MEKGEKTEKRRTFVEQREKPEPLDEHGYWIVARKHPEKSRVEAWRWIESQLPPTTIGSATLLAEPAPRPKQVDNYTAGVVAEGMERRDEEKEVNMRRAMGLPPEESQEDSG